MKNSVLLTRSYEANKELKLLLNNKNVEILECNLIKYKLLPIDIDYIKNFSGLIITSNFVASNLPSATYENMPVWVVGTKSAKILEQKGYMIKACTSSAMELCNTIPLEENILYLSGNYITINMPENVTRKISYMVTYLSSLSDKQILRYKQGIDYILLYSENCAKTLLTLFKENNLLNYIENTTVLAISSKVGLVFATKCKNIVITPNSELMIKNIK